MATDINKIDCHQVKKLFYEWYFQGQVSAPASTLPKTNEVKLHRKKVTIKYGFLPWMSMGRKHHLIKCH